MNSERKAFLADLKDHGEALNIPNVTLLNAKFLHFLVGLKKPQNLLEIGTANGYSTIWLANALESYNGKLTGLEVSEPGYIEACKNIKTAGLADLCTLHFCNALEWLNTYEGPKFDMVFIDARKAYYHEFLQKIIPLITDDALVVIDDVTKFPDKTKKFHALVFSMKDWEHVTLPIDPDDGVMLLQKSIQKI